MNKAEREARRIYEANKQRVENGELMPIKVMMDIAFQQDKLYKIIHARADQRDFFKGTSR